MCALKVGVVGAAGQVGIAMLRGLNTGTGVTAVGICRNTVSAARVVAQGLTVRTVQTDDPQKLTEATRDLDAIVTARCHNTSRPKTSAANRQFAEALAQAGAGKHLVHLSSVAVYGEFTSGDSSRFRAPRPDTMYGRQKLRWKSASQICIEAWNEVYDFAGRACLRA